MGKSKLKKDGIWGKFLPFFELFLCILIIFMFVYKTGLSKNIKAMQMLMLAGVIISLSAGGWFCYKNKFQWKYIITSFLAAGFIMRIGYMLYTPFNVRPHDLGDITLDGYGHAAYILKLMINHKLPETNWVQFYHPPLFHFLAACVCSFVNVFMKWTTYEEVLESAKIVSCFASCGCLLLIPGLCDELKLTERAKAFAVGIIAVFPNCYLLAGRVNNDSLVIFFITVAILFTIKWAKEPSWYHTIVLALAFGLGMMTKVSCGTIAMFTAPIMIAAFIRSIKEKKWVLLLEKIVVFGAISFPLGLWYPIRNMLLFKQPFNYVAQISIDSEIYTGDVSVFRRFIQFPIKNLFSPVYAYPWEDSNVSMYVIKSSMFGEFQYNISEWIPKALVFFNLILILLSLFAMIYMAVKIKTNKMLRIGMPVLWVLLYGFFIYFNIQYPFGCTMDFRYIVPTAYMGAVFLGVTFDYMWDKNTLTAVAYKVTAGVAAVMFGVFSILMFCFIK